MPELTARAYCAPVYSHSASSRLRWAQVDFSERGYGDTRKFEKAFAATDLRHFRFTILKSSSDKYPGAAQVSEVEVLP